jgi:hypothetical protein
MRTIERYGGDEELLVVSVPSVVARHDSAEAISVGLSTGGDCHASLAMTVLLDY